MLLVTAVTAVAGIVPMDDPGDGWRALNVYLGIIAVGLLAWRQIGRWSLMSWLSRMVVGLLGSLTTIVAVGTARAAMLDAPFNEAQYALTVHFVCTIVVCLVWHRLLDRTGKRH